MNIKSIRTYKIFVPLFFIRDFLWKKMGLFEKKKSIKQKRYFRKVAREDMCRRKQIAAAINSLQGNMLKSKNGINIIVSMTSYGRRVESTCPYAIYSILTQKQLPNRIILNLDKEKWRNDNLPQLIKKLQKVGVEVNFIEDIGPHSKLLPTLAKYPDDIIITADDDVLYDSTLVSELVETYMQSDKQSVICREATCSMDTNGNFIIYSKQPFVVRQTHAKYLIPLGVAGVLYPPHVFSQEIFNYEIIRKLCPKADDIWFGIMEIVSDLQIYYIANNSYNENNVVDRNEEYNSEISGALHFINDGEKKNDSQWNALINYYKL